MLPYHSSKLVVTANNICEPSWSTRVSTDLLDRIFPAMEPTEVLHFTKPDLLQSILLKKQIWLAHVAKNFDAGEYLAFVREHGFASASSKKIRRALAESFFYASFTVPGSASTDSHWSVFADGGTGFCLRLHLTPNTADLRRIRYQPATKSLLTMLDEDLRAKIRRTFLPRGVARMTAFSLKQHLAHEDEIRLLVANPPAASKFKSGADSYIAIPIGQANPWCDIKLLGITCGRGTDVQIIADIARTAGLTNVMVDAR